MSWLSGLFGGGGGKTTTVMKTAEENVIAPVTNVTLAVDTTPIGEALKDMAIAERDVSKEAIKVVEFAVIVGGLLFAWKLLKKAKK